MFAPPPSRGQRSAKMPMFKQPHYSNKCNKIYIAKLNGSTTPKELRRYVSEETLKGFQNPDIYFILGMGDNKSVKLIEYTPEFKKLKETFQKMYQKKSEVKIFGNSKELSLENLLKSSDDQNTT